MSMTVKRRKESATKKVFMHRIADVRGGVSVKASELGDGYIYEGNVLSKPDADGLCHILKFVRFVAVADDEATTYQVEKGHNLKVGDNLEGKAITAIDKTSRSYDTVTLEETLDKEVAIGDISAMENAANAEPFALVGTTKPAPADTNCNVDAWLIGVTYGNPLPSDYETALKGIINY